MKWGFIMIREHYANNGESHGIRGEIQLETAVTWGLYRDDRDYMKYGFYYGTW